MDGNWVSYKTGQTTPNYRMLNYLQSQVIKRAKEYTSTSDYLTFTRNNGLEIVTIAERRVTVTDLTISENKPASYYLNIELEFDPTSLVVNKCEELLCLYDKSNVQLFSLHLPGSKISYAAFYPLKLDLEKDERVVQVVFNNISKYQSEVVILTNYAIKCYNINESLDTPVQIYNFDDEAIASTQAGNFDLSLNESSVTDPVSLSFGSAESLPSKYSSYEKLDPRGDLSLFILTSDTSLYKIYPFLPNELSVSEEWLTSLFDYSSISYNSEIGSGAAAQAQMVPTLKFAALISETTGSCKIRDALPPSLQRGKIVGPLLIQPFPEELYNDDALQLIPLINDVIIVITNHSVLALFDDQAGSMIFENQTLDRGDSIGVLTTIEMVNFSNARGGIDIDSGLLQSNTLGSIILTTAQPSVIQVDFSKWMEKLDKCIRENDLTDFIEQIDQLPTSISNLGSLVLPPSSKKPTPQITTGFSIQSFDDVPLPKNKHKLWIAWDDFVSYGIARGDSTFVFHELSFKTPEEELGNLRLLEAPKYGSIEPKEDETYASKITGSYKKEVDDVIRQSKLIISKLINQILTLKTNGFYLDVNSVESLDTLQTVSELIGSTVIQVYKVLGAMNKRLVSLKSEFMNQITTLNTVKLMKEQQSDNFEMTNDRISKLKERQVKINERFAKLSDNVSDIVLGQNSEEDDVDLSKKETVFVAELNKLLSIVKQKEAEFTNIKLMMDNYKEADLEKIREEIKKVKENSENVKTLEEFKKRLDNSDKLMGLLLNDVSSSKA